MNQKTELPCCPRFDPDPWDERELHWHDKLFVKDSVLTFMHIPLNLMPVTQRMWKQASDAGAAPDLKDWVLLSHDPNAWRSDQYLAVTREVPGMEHVRFTGTMLSKVFEGPYREAGKWHSQMIEYAKSQGKDPEKIFFFYTTCPKCAKIYGKNYVVALAQVGNGASPAL